MAYCSLADLKRFAVDLAGPGGNDVRSTILNPGRTRTGNCRTAPSRGYARRCARGGRTPHGPSLREKLIDVSRSLSKTALSLQVRAGRGDSITLGIENRDLITVIALVVERKLVSVIAMCAGCHSFPLDETLG